ncbi:MAG: iron uptake porin [Thermosynechococcaceae cyanobacterium]
MVNTLWKSVLFSPALMGLMLLAPSGAIANEALGENETQGSLEVIETGSSEVSEIEAPSVEPNLDITSIDALESQADSLGQVTSVSQLSDVRPTDWAFQALQSLVERYGCIAGYPNGTFRGNRSATRYEMAAALNACLDQISDRFASKADLDAVKALQDEFAAELATLRGRVDGLESRVATVESQQFSTTTKLNGEVIFATGYAFDDQDGAGVNLDSDATGDDRLFLSSRVRLNFDTSFNGKDRLRVRLASENITQGNDFTGTRLARYAFDGDSDNAFFLDELNYRFEPIENLTVKINAAEGEYQDDINTFNPYFESSGSGSLQRFTRFNPIYRQGNGGQGVTLTYDAGFATIDLGYLAVDGASPTDDGATAQGLFGGSYAALAQIGIKPFKNTDLQLGLTYVRSHYEPGNEDLAGGTADDPTRRPFGNDADVNADHLGAQISYQPKDWLSLSGWAGYTFARDSASDAEAQLLNWGAVAAFPDLFGEGNVGALAVGQQPSIVGGSGGVNAASDGSQRNWIVQAQYKFKVNENIAITPGLFVILNTLNNGSNDAIFMPVIRTTFKF